MTASGCPPPRRRSSLLHCARSIKGDTPSRNSTL
jgi:hypothetical protein